MSIRDAIVRQQRRGMLISLAGFALIVLGIVWGGGQHPWLTLVIPGFVAFAAGAVHQLFLIRCPSCRGALGFAMSHPSSPFSVSPKIRFCPFCGVSLDTELPPEARS